MDYKTYFIKNLKNYRKENNLTQDDLAEILGYSQKNIAKWEQGFTLPPLDVLIELSKLMDATLDEILGLKYNSNLIPLNEKSISDDCVDYIIKNLNIDPEEILECLDTLEDGSTVVLDKTTEFERVDSNISFMMMTFGDFLLDNSIDIKSYVENKIKNKEGETAITYLKDNKHIVEDDNGFSFSDEFALECINTSESFCSAWLLFNQKELAKAKSQEFVDQRNIDFLLHCIEDNREKLKKIAEIKNSLIKK